MDFYLSWLDYSEDHRRRMLDFIDQFRERDTRDELGIGSIRDAFAERLFPGTSTIQTRARYFLFIPWIYLSLENDEGRAFRYGLDGHDGPPPDIHANKWLRVRPDLLDKEPESLDILAPRV